MTNIFEFIDNQIIYKRKTGYSLQEIFKYKQTQEPGEDDMLSLTHVVRVCHEFGLPYTLSQIKRVFNKIHKQEYHGSKIGALNFIKQFAGKKLLKFEVETSVAPQKHLSGPIKTKQRAIVGRDNDDTVEILNGVQNG